MPVIDDTVVPPSLIESAAMCECASMMPGDELAGCIDDLRAGGDVGRRADGGNLAVAQDDRPVRDRSLRHGQDRGAFDGDHARRAARRRWLAQK